MSLVIGRLRTRLPLAAKMALVTAGIAGGKLKAIAWRVEDTDAGRRLLNEGGAVHVVGKLKPDDWQGREGVQLEIEDVADPRQVS